MSIKAKQKISRYKKQKHPTPHVSNEQSKSYATAQAAGQPSLMILRWKCKIMWC